MFGLLIVVALFIFGVVGAALVMLMRAQNPTSRKYDTQANDFEDVIVKEPEPARTHRNISDLLNIEMHDSGVFHVNGRWVGLARLSGTNFDVLSGIEQDIREDVLIGIQSQINYPIQYITSTIIADTDRAAEEIMRNAAQFNDENLAAYATMYAQELENMKIQRRAMSQVTWLVITDNGRSGNPVAKIREKMLLLQETFRKRAKIILTPLISIEESVDVLKDIMLPEKLVKPSEELQAGVLEPIKFNIREVRDIA